jgi:type VI secretion system protein ImpC
MAKSGSIKFGGVNLTAGEQPAAVQRPEPSTPFRILVLGNFSGRTGSGTTLANRRSVMVDRDNFEEVLTRSNVTIRLPVTGGEAGVLEIPIKELDDFHPDRLYENLKLFEVLRGLRRRLANPKTFADAAAEVRAWAPAPPAAEPAAKPPVSADISPTNLLEQMLGVEATVSAASQEEPNWNALVSQIVQPYLLPGKDPQADELTAAVDEASASHLRGILHHPGFQALEAAWRAVHFLTRRLDTGTSLKVFLLDVSREELAADLDGLHKLLVEQTVGTPGAPPWAVIAGNYTFAAAADDSLLLLRLARIARQAGAPFLAAAHPGIVGCASLAETPDPDDWQPPAATVAQKAWESLRRIPEAAYLGLALPRFLLRLPYGKGGTETEQFPFEEFPDTPSHEHFLWGNPALACVLLLGQAFSQQGWEMEPGEVEEIDGLPAYAYDEHGERVLKPCAEVSLVDRAAEVIADAGLIPLRSVRGSDSVLVRRFRSLANPPTGLAGRWS